jgi:DNA-binding LacI/PurR family transcriptional regulator
MIGLSHSLVKDRVLSTAIRQSYRFGLAGGIASRYHATGCMVRMNGTDTIADIALEAGVSKSTVSRALNDSPLISVATKERIRTIARERRFEMHEPARRLSLGQSNVIALVTHETPSDPTLTDAFMLEIISGLSTALHTAGYDLLLIQASLADSDWVNRYHGSGRVDGFVVLGSHCAKRHLKTLVASGTPFVVWGLEPAQQNYGSVSGDNFTGGKLATEHMIRAGRGHIAFVGAKAGEAEVDERYRGYAAALQEAGLEVAPERVVFGDWSPTSAAASMAALLDTDPQLDGAFVSSDMMAIAAIDLLRSRGRRVPEDVAVVGYDDVAIAEHCDPPLTTIRQSGRLAGRLLAESVVQTLGSGAVAKISIPAELVVRRSA